jgi:hypothetical protein
MNKRNLDHLTTKNIMREIISTASAAVGEAGGNTFDLTHILGAVLMAVIIEHTPDDMVIAAFDLVTGDVREHAATMFPQKGKYDA